MRIKLKKNYVMIDLELSITEKEKTDYESLERKMMKVISISGDVFADKHNIYGIGQSREELKQYIMSEGNELNMREKEYLYRIYRIWCEFGGNGLKVGTKNQIDYLLDHNNGFGYEYAEACEILKEVNLYEDRGEKYGNKWFCKEIPEETLKELIYIFENFEIKTKGRKNG